MSEPIFLRHSSGLTLDEIAALCGAAIETAPATNDPCGRYNAYTATPTSVQTAMYNPTKGGTARRRPLACARRRTAGAVPGSIIAAIITTHRATKNANDPSGVATPMSIPFICWTVTTQHPAARPSVAVNEACRTCTVSLLSCSDDNSTRNHRLPF